MLRKRGKKKKQIGRCNAIYAYTESDERTDLSS